MATAEVIQTAHAHGYVPTNTNTYAATRGRKPTCANLLAVPLKGHRCTGSPSDHQGGVGHLLAGGEHPTQAVVHRHVLCPDPTLVLQQGGRGGRGALGLAVLAGKGATASGQGVQVAGGVVCSGESKQTKAPSYSSQEPRTLQWQTATQGDVCGMSLHPANAPRLAPVLRTGRTNFSGSPSSISPSR
jgi:hypothetical protein